VWQQMAKIWTDSTGNIWHDLLAITLRSLITFIVVLAVVRFTGKRSIANLAPFDLAMVILIGEVAAIPVGGQEPLFKGLLPAILIGLFHVATTWTSLYVTTVEHLTEGVPTLLVKDGKVIKKNLVKERISMADLMTGLRHKEVTDLNMVKEAHLEHAGGISVILKPQNEKVTVEQLDQKLQRAVDEIARRHAEQLHREVMALIETQRK
jgi:uncharacterized membrane protein YcaP (DUF421 family)